MNRLAGHGGVRHGGFQPKSTARRWAPALVNGLLFVSVLTLTSACGQSEPSRPVPEIELAEMEPQVRKRLLDTRAAVLADTGSAEAWGRFAMVAHAHEMWEEADTSYQEAEAADAEDPRWPYFRGDVLSVVGTELETAVVAFRRALTLRPGYAPAHLRLGKVLVALGNESAAALEFERALELAPDLQPARVALAQILLASGEAEAAAGMVEAVLAEAPRHEQALSTLGQAYMRLGRREEAREVAELARNPAAYNLFSDPLMSQVVAEGVSSVLVWDRAKAFLDNGNYQQAALGLRRVVELQPSNIDAHHQLATAYGNLGEIEGARRHLERTVTARPESAAARLQLATVYLEQRAPEQAIPHLRRVLEIAPDDPDAAWLLARAMVEAGDTAGGLRAFELNSANGLAVPGWAHDEWGRVLAQSGRPEEALEHFRSALALNPRDAQALFFTGLLFEGYGRVEEAVVHYCRSIEAAPNPPSSERLRALGRDCA